MKNVIVLLSMVSVLLLCSACAPAEEQSAAVPVANVTTPAPQETLNETRTESAGTPAPTEEVTILNTTQTPAELADLSGCPLISPQKVMAECARDALPSVAIVNDSCVFGWEGNYTLSIASTPATADDFDQWMNDYPTSFESGELAPRAARAEVRRIQHFVWFTGARLIEAISNSPLACNGDRIWHAAGAINTTASIGTDSNAFVKGVALDAGKKEIDTASLFSMLTMKYTISGALTGNGSGSVKANWDAGTYSLLVDFKDVPAPAATHHYEGWLVKKGTTWNVIDTGGLQVMDGVYKNLYRSSTDLRDHLFYVLTLEKDGVPGPSTIVLEGRLG